MGLRINKATAPPDPRCEIYHKWFSRKFEAKKYTGRQYRFCWQHLVRSTHRCGQKCFGNSLLMILDHFEPWQHRSTKEWIFVGHNYGIQDDHLKELKKLSAQESLSVWIDDLHSWYYPDHTTLVAVYASNVNFEYLK